MSILFISFLKSYKAGGIGDRVIGILNIKLLAKLLNRPFYINWEREDISNYFTIKNDYSNNKNNNKKRFLLLNHFNRFIDEDKKQSLKNFLENASLKEVNEYFDSNIDCEFLNNIFFIEHLYKNPLFSHENYINDCLDIYKELFNNILIPTDFLNNKIQSIIQNYSNIIGIQIRTGDKYIITNQDDFGGKNGDKAHNAIQIYAKVTPDKIENYLFEVLNNIKKDINEIYNSKIFITSDYNNIYKIANKIWDSNKLLYNNDIVQHIDRNPVNADFSKTFVDLIILSKYCNYLYISPWSNYGKTALLCNNNINYAKNINNLNNIYKNEIVNNTKKAD